MVALRPPPLTDGRTATYQPVIIWGTGTPIDTEEYDDVSGWYLNQPGLQVTGIGRDQIRAYSPPAPPAFDLTLQNWTGRFSPGGPIGRFVGRGPRASLWATWGVGPEVGVDDPDVRADDHEKLANGYEGVELFRGTVTTADQTLTRPNRSVRVRALGSLATLLDKRPSTTRLYEGITTSEAITVILDLVGWPPGDRVIDTGDTTLLYWWLDGSETALSAIQRLLAAEGAGGAVYEQAGYFHFEGREYRQDALRSTVARWIIASVSKGRYGQTPGVDADYVRVNDDAVLVSGATAELLQDTLPTEFRTNPDEVISSAVATINQRTATPIQKVWEYGQQLVLSSGETRIITAAPSDPFKLAVTPFDGVDYTVTIGALSSVVLLDTSGVTARIQLTAGPSGATVLGQTSNGIQLRAVSLPVTSSQVIRSTIDTSEASARYASREHDMGLWPEVVREVALDICNSMVTRYSQERRQAVIRLTNLDPRHLRAMLSLRISDRIIWMHEHGGINEPYWVEQIDHDISPGGGLHVVTLGCERVFDLHGARFDSAKFDEDVYSD